MECLRERGSLMSRAKLLSMLIANPSCDKKIYPHNWLPYFKAKELKWLFSDLQELGFLRSYPDHFELSVEQQFCRLSVDGLCLKHGGGTGQRTECGGEEGARWSEYLLKRRRGA